MSRRADRPSPATPRSGVAPGARASAAGGAAGAGAGAATARAEADAAIDWLRGFARERLQSFLMDRRRSIPPHVVLELGNRGLLGMQLGKELGGLALGHVDAARVVAQLGAIDLSLATFVGNNGFLGIRPIDRFGGPDLRDHWLPRLGSGRVLAAFALTEPAAGSNPRAIETHAVLGRDGSLRVSGAKVWSGSASWAGVLNVFAQTSSEAGERIGMTAFAVPADRAGVRFGAEALTLGMRGMVQSAITFNGAVIEPGEVLGDVGAGLAVAQDCTSFCRLGIAAISVGGMRRALQLLRRYAGRRHVGTGLLADNPVTRLRVAEIAAGTRALAALVESVARRLDERTPVSMDAFSACKVLGPELLWRAADWLVQGLGGRGYMESNVAARLLRDARVFRIFEGPTETIQMFLGSRLLGARKRLPELVAEAGGDAWLEERLAAAVASLRDRAPGGAFASAFARSEWRSYLAGEIFAWGILAASVRAAAGRAGSGVAPELARWAEQELERRAALAVSAEHDPTRVLATEDAAIDDELAILVGDVEQRLAGEDVELDPLLGGGTGED